MMTPRRLGTASLVAALLPLLTASAADPKYLPKDTEIVFTINVKQILASDLVKTNKDAVDQAKTMLENQAGDNPAMKYLTDAGFNVFRDLHSITVASNGSKEPTAIIVKGTFNGTKLGSTAAAAAQGNPDVMKISKIGAQTLYEITPPGDTKAFVALLDGKVLLATSTKDNMTAALDRAKGTDQLGLKKEFAVLLDTVNEKQSVNFVATGAALATLVNNSPIPNGNAAAAALQNIDGLSGAVTIAKDIQFQIGINARDEAGAQKMAKEGTGFLLVAQFLVGQQVKKDEKLAPLLDVVKTLRITAQGTNVVLRGAASLEVIEKLMSNYAK